MDATGTLAVPVVTPGGKDGYGQDTAWARYSNDDPVLENSSCETGSDGELTWPSGDRETTTAGRHTACEQSTRFVPTLLLRPRLVRKDFDDKRRTGSSPTWTSPRRRRARRRWST
jgi:hypothetical protein